VVYWASNLYAGTDATSRTGLTYNRMMWATTDDFVSFSEPQVWIDSQRGNGTDGLGSIDVTVQEADGVYYRVYKDESTMRLRQERSTNLLATVTGTYPGTVAAADAWSTVGTDLGHNQPNGYGGSFTAGEGPSLFKANAGDENGYQYYLFADQPSYHGGPNHYVPMATTDITDASAWTVIGDQMPEESFPTNSDGGKPRHGTVLPVTRSQYQTVLEAYAPALAVVSVDAMGVITQQGSAPTLPTSAHLTKADGSTEDAVVVWAEVPAGSYETAGEFTVTGVAQDDSRQPVEVTVTVLGTPAPEVPTRHLVAAYDFTSTPTDGRTVEDTAPDSTLGAAVVQNATPEHWQDSALTLTGGAKTGSGGWVRLPDDILADATSATVQAEVKADATMLDDYHFLWNVGNDVNAEYFFAALKCSGGRTPLVGIKASGTETLRQAESCAQADRWLSVTSVIDGEQSPAVASLYIDGVKVASGTVPATPKDVDDQSFSTIGRSPWPDGLFRGALSTFRVYDTALTAEEIARISDRDAMTHDAEIAGYAQQALDDLGVDDQTVNDAYIGLPTADGAVTWQSSDPDTVAPTGLVNQPPQGAPAKTVTLTATAVVRGMTATKTVTLTVAPTDRTDQEVVDAAAMAYVVPGVLRSGDTLPVAVAGTTAVVQDADGFAVSSDGVITIEGEAPVTGTVDVVITKASVPGASVTKTFTLTVLPAQSSQTLAAYDRVPTSERVANNGDIAYSMHLALQADGDEEYTPLNENYGVFFARTATPHPANTDISTSRHRSLKDPAVFRMADGTYGVVAVRTNRGSGIADSTGRSSILLATSTDLLAYDELADSRSIVDVGETNGVNHPYAVYDTAESRYVVAWTDDSGVPKYTTFDELTDSSSPHDAVRIGQVSTTGVLADSTSAPGIEDFDAGNAIAVDDTTATALDRRFGRISNTGYTPFDKVVVEQGSGTSAIELPESVELTYSDGSTGTLPIGQWDLTGVDTSTPGTYEAVATVKQTEYPLPFAEERADPSVYKWRWTHDGSSETKYLMIATNDIYGDNVGQNGSPHMPVRMADTISGLADVPGDTGGLVGSDGYHPGESVLRTAGDSNTDGRVITGSFWAPEFHEIDGTLTILFMPSYNNTWTDGAAAFMQLKNDASGDPLDPTRAESWTDPQTITRADGTPLARTATGGVGMSLDMTYFQDEAGQSYYAWQQLGAVYIATMDPSDPAHVTSNPVRIVAPEYAWDNAIAEGPNVVTRDGRLYLIYSGSTVGTSYTTGLAMADASGATDLTDPASWSKLNYPIQKSGVFNGTWQLGTGHGMWSEDEDGNMIYVFHAYATATDGYRNFSGRDMFVRRVHWAADGMPIFDMDGTEELSPEVTARRVSLTVEVSSTDPGDPTDPVDPGDPTDPVDPTDPTDPTDPGGPGDPADPAGAGLVLEGSSVVVPGGSITVRGSGFVPGESVVLELRSEPVRLATVAADAAGAFRVTVVVPVSVPVGEHRLSAIGQESGRVVSVAVTVVAAGPPGSGGRLAATGAGVAGVLAVALGLVAAGAALRRRGEAGGRPPRG
ncbi:MAG TPA: family 43 glycosylhydrolase, partial [Friedmanniella sp.]